MSKSFRQPMTVIRTGKLPIGDFFKFFSQGHRVAEQSTALLKNVMQYQEITTKEGLDNSGNGFWCASFMIVNGKANLEKTIEELPYSREDIKGYANQPQELGTTLLKQMKEYDNQLKRAHDARVRAEEVIKDIAGPAGFSNR